MTLGKNVKSSLGVFLAAAFEPTVLGSIRVLRVRWENLQEAKSSNHQQPACFSHPRDTSYVLSVSNSGCSADILSAVSPIFNRQRVSVPGRVELSRVSGLQIRDTAECNSALRPWLDTLNTYDADATHRLTQHRKECA